MKIRKCPEHGYTLKGVCSKCGKETKDAHYKFAKVREIDDGARKE